MWKGGEILKSIVKFYTDQKHQTSTDKKGLILKTNLVGIRVFDRSLCLFSWYGLSEVQTDWLLHILGI